jgi:hypothetical protein
VEPENELLPESVRVPLPSLTTSSRPPEFASEPANVEEAPLPPTSSLEVSPALPMSILPDPRNPFTLSSNPFRSTLPATSRIPLPSPWGTTSLASNCKVPEATTVFPEWVLAPPSATVSGPLVVTLPPTEIAPVTQKRPLSELSDRSCPPPIPPVIVVKRPSDLVEVLLPIVASPSSAMGPSYVIPCRLLAKRSAPFPDPVPSIRSGLAYLSTWSRESRTSDAPEATTTFPVPSLLPEGALDDLVATKVPRATVSEPNICAELLRTTSVPPPSNTTPGPETMVLSSVSLLPASTRMPRESAIVSPASR